MNFLEWKALLCLLYPAAVWGISEVTGANAVIRNLQARQRGLYPVRWAGLALILLAAGGAFWEDRLLAGVALGLTLWMFWRGLVLMRWGWTLGRSAMPPEWLQNPKASTSSLKRGGAALCALSLAGTVGW